MVTRGNQASGETGLNIWIRGLTAFVHTAAEPAQDAQGNRHQVRNRKPAATVTRLVGTWSTKVGLPVYLRHFTAASGLAASLFALRSCWRW